MKLDENFRKFMYGRYGLDDLYKFLFELYIVLLIINLFLKSKILNLISIFIVFYMFFRFFSKKIYARSNENQLFLKIKKKIIKPFRVIKMNITDKDHIYKKCSKCGTILKLPLQSKAGFKKAKCPKCNKKVRLFTFKKEKIEIVKKGVKNA
jgi:uncharacterized protein YggT (Ycf19 family)/phage FluMu protein Com